MSLGALREQVIVNLGAYTTGASERLAIQIDAVMADHPPPLRNRARDGCGGGGLLEKECQLAEERVQSQERRQGPPSQEGPQGQ